MGGRGEGGCITEMLVGAGGKDGEVLQSAV